MVRKGARRKESQISAGNSKTHARAARTKKGVHTNVGFFVIMIPAHVWCRKQRLWNIQIIDCTKARDCQKC